MDLKELGEIAIHAAKKAAVKIMEIYRSDFESELKADRSPVTIADKNSSKLISAELVKTGIMVISEEETIPAYKYRKNEAYIWLVDPLDGTKEFIRKNNEFCICIALIRNQKPVLGIIYSPTEGEGIVGGLETGVFRFTAEQKKHFEPKQQINVIAKSTVDTIAYSRSHPNSQMTKMTTLLEANFGQIQTIRKGSALKFLDLALGRADLYPRFAPTMEWDIAAGQAIYEAIGGEVINITTFEPLKYNKESLLNPHFIAKNLALDIARVWKEK